MNFVYRIPLKFLCDFGLVNQCFKFNTKYILTLETDMQRLFEINVNQAADALSRTVEISRLLINSYNTELVSTKIKCVQLENASNTHSSLNTVKFDTIDAHDEYLFYM